MVEKHNNKDEASSIQIICKNSEIDLQKEKEFFLKQDIERQKSLIETKEEVGKVKDMLKENSAFNESLRRKLEAEEEIEKDEPKEKEKVNKGRKSKNNLKEKVNSDSVVKAKMEVVNQRGKKCNSFKEKIDERLKLIERSIAETQRDSLTELTKNLKILNTPLEIDRKRDITVLNTTELSHNEKTDRQINNIICHKCKGYGHTKKQCDRHNKNVKCIKIGRAHV